MLAWTTLPRSNSVNGVREQAINRHYGLSATITASNGPASYLESLGFKSRPGDGLTRDFFVVLYKTYTKMLGQHLKLGHDPFRPRLFLNKLIILSLGASASVAKQTQRQLTAHHSTSAPDFSEAARYTSSFRYVR